MNPVGACLTAHSNKWSGGDCDPLGFANQSGISLWKWREVNFGD